MNDDHFRSLENEQRISETEEFRDEIELNDDM